MSNIDTIIFDLDGTLLNTLDDLADAVNYALRTHGLPTHSYEAVRLMVGNGVSNLVLRGAGLQRLNPSAPADVEWLPVPPEEAPVTPEEFERIFATFRAYYVDHCQQKTRLYDGISELLYILRARDYRMAIVSNKLQTGVTELQKVYFRDLIDVAIGEREGIPRKPAPGMVDAALRALCRDGETPDDVRSRAVYVGDSDVDILTARNAGMPCISVLWGFRDEAFLRRHGATCFAHEPKDVLLNV